MALNYIVNTPGILKSQHYIHTSLKQIKTQQQQVRNYSFCEIKLVEMM